MQAIDFEVPQFTQADVIRIVGCSEKTLQNWTSRGVLKLSVQNPGRARRRLYSARDMVKVRAMLLLSGLGLAPAYAADFVEQIVDKRASQVKKRLAGKISDEKWLGSGWNAYIYPGEDTPNIEVNKGGIQAMYAAFARGVAPGPKVYIHIEIDGIIFETLRDISNLLLRELGPDELDDQED